MRSTTAARSSAPATTASRGSLRSCGRRRAGWWTYPSIGWCGVAVGVVVLAVPSQFASRVIQNGAQKVCAGGDQILTGSLGTGPVRLSRPHDQDGTIRQRREQRGIRGDQDRRSIEDDDVEMAGEVVEQTSELMRLEHFGSAPRKGAARQQPEPCDLRGPTERPARGIGKRCPVSLQQLDQTWSGGNAKYPVQTGAPQVTVNQENPDPLTREGDREVRRDHGLPLLRSCAGDQDRPLAIAPSEQQAGIQQAKRLGSARQRGRVGDDFPRRLLATAGGLGPTAR